MRPRRTRCTRRHVEQGVRIVRGDGLGEGLQHCAAGGFGSTSSTYLVHSAVGGDALRGRVGHGVRGVGDGDVDIVDASSIVCSSYWVVVTLRWTVYAHLFAKVLPVLHAHIAVMKRVCLALVEKWLMPKKRVSNFNSIYNQLILQLMKMATPLVLNWLKQKWDHQMQRGVDVQL